MGKDPMSDLLDGMMFGAASQGKKKGKGKGGMEGDMEFMMMEMMLDGMMAPGMDDMFGDDDFEKDMVKEWNRMDEKDRGQMLKGMSKSERKEFENIIAKHNKKKGEDTKKKADSDGDGWETDSQEEEKSKSKSEKTEVKEVHIEGNE